MKKNIVSILSIALLIAGLILTFINGVLAIVCTVIVLALSIKKIKNKNILNTVILIFSIILLSFQIISFITAIVLTNQKLSEAKLKTYLVFEEQMEFQTKRYAKSQEIGSDSISVFSMNDLNLKHNDCNGYIIYDSKTDTAEAYISCKEYQTEGFKSSYLK